MQSPPLGAAVIDVGAGPIAPNARRLSPSEWRGLRGPVCFTSPGDGGRAASAAAERLAASGVEATWVEGTVA